MYFSFSTSRSQDCLAKSQISILQLLYLSTGRLYGMEMRANSMKPTLHFFLTTAKLLIVPMARKPAWMKKQCRVKVLMCCQEYIHQGPPLQALQVPRLTAQRRQNQEQNSQQLIKDQEYILVHDEDYEINVEPLSFHVTANWTDIISSTWT